MPVVLGIDISKEVLDTCILKEISSKKAKYKSFDYTKTGVNKLIQYAISHKVTDILFEATGGLEEQLSIILLSKEKFNVYLNNPRDIRNYAKSSRILAKTDKIDSFVIAKFAFGIGLQNLTIKKLRSEKEIVLKGLVKRRNSLIKMKIEEKNRLRLVRNKIILKDIILSIKRLEKSTLLMEKAMLELLSLSPGIKAKYDVLSKETGVGNFTALALIAFLPELGLLNRGQIASLAGLAPMSNDSGKRKGVRYIQGGRSAVRLSLYMSALSSKRHNKRMKEFSDRLLSRGKKKMVVVTAVMRKLLIRLNMRMKVYYEETGLKENISI